MARGTFQTEERFECPHCGAPLARATGLPSIDKPFEQCASCAAFLILPGANEWDLLKLGQKIGHIARHTFGALIVGLALALVPLAAVLGVGWSWKLRDGLLWLAIGMALAGAWEYSRLAGRIRRSRRRMGDPMYLAKLAEYQLAAIARR